MSPSSRREVLYNPGNLGDLLKHGWLVEIVRFLRRQKAGEPVLYADTFCGFPEYDIGEKAAQRIRERFHILPFRRLQEPFLARGKYAGSVTLARLAADGHLRAFLYDINPEAVASFPAGAAERLDIQSGCDILDSRNPYDLIFLDPYDDIWGGCETVLTRSASRLKVSSILLFLPFRTAAQRDFLVSTVDRLGVNHQLGIVMNPGNPFDGKCHFAAVFMPAHALNLGAVLGLFGELNIVTSRVTALASNP